MDALYTFGDQLAKESAEWYPIYGDLLTKKKIAVQNMNETRNNYGLLAENLSGDSETLTLRTRYQYNYSPPQEGQIQHIRYRGKFYEIKEVRPMELGTMGIYRYKEYLLFLTEVNYGRDFQGEN